MRLHQLLDTSGIRGEPGTPDVMVTGLTSDSRAVGPGMMFAALPGSAIDGSAFIASAVAKGAVAVLCGAAVALPSLPPSVALVRVAEPRLALAKIAAAFYPRQPATIVAVTGTNGKTSIAEFTRQIWAQLGHKAASLGTIGVVKGDGAVYGSLTTPDPITLHKTLQDLADEGITHLALEASSHGLDQFRLDGVRLAAGAFNNLGRDHLDYHRTDQEYLNAKLKLFERLLSPGMPAVVNFSSNPNWATDKALKTARKRDLVPWVVKRGNVSDQGHVTFWISDVKRVGFDQYATVDVHGFDVQGLKYANLHIPLIGDYQVGNVLVAAAFALATGDEPARVFATLPQLKTVNGRLDVVGHHNGGIAVVDYAHKPEALEAALDALRPFATGKLICVFGCGGNRDKGKRPIMGEIALRKADIVIVTDDNPRNEDPGQIRSEILVAAADATEIGDRATAIRAGIAMLEPGDVLLVAGKGHESGQIVGAVTLPFSDHDEIVKAIREAAA